MLKDEKFSIDHVYQSTNNFGDKMSDAIGRKYSTGAEKVVPTSFKFNKKIKKDKKKEDEKIQISN